MLSKLYGWYGRRQVLGVGALILVLLVAGLVLKLQSDVAEDATSVVPTVSVAKVSELGGTDSISFIGSVRAVSEAQIQSESAGRVTGVSVSLGETVSAGQVIASIENAQQRAAVLQAEGVYEAAVAAASVGDLSVTQAETSLRTTQTDALGTLQSSYTTVSNGFFSLIDQMYNNPTSPLPSVYITGGNGAYLRSERVAFQAILEDWQVDLNDATAEDDLESLLSESIVYTTRARNLVDAFIVAFQERSTETLNGTAVTVWSQQFSALRASLDATITALQSAQTSLTTASDTLEQAKLGGTVADVSAANAQVKQAQGALLSAQASLNKTIMRSPIAGTINELNVRTGDYLSMSQPVAKVANNNALEITVYVGASDLDKITVGTPVVIEGGHSGVVTHIGAGIDSQTQKTEVKIATETTELTNGDTVAVSLTSTTADSGETNLILLPITAIKFTADEGFVYTINDGTLVEHPITVGAIHGSYVEVTAGVTSDMEIVVDARGLIAGSRVEAQQ